MNTQQVFISILFITGLILKTAAQPAATTVLPLSVQIKVAEMAAPENKRKEAKIYGYNEQGEFVVLREGQNDFVCLAPKPSQSMLYAYAYPATLDPFMARGRELTAEGKKTKQKDEIREIEIKAGQLYMPQSPSALYGYWGKASNLDHETGEIKEALRRYVIYIPYAKAEDLGLPDKPALPGMPWLMDSGSYKAHIMINPEKMTHSH